ncbi:MAG: cation diffusion facilitator family transporter [Saprospiraceae bacterium]
MGHHHDHGHHHHHHGGDNLKLAFFLNLGFTILEIFGGLYVNSVAIISDAVHDLGDSLSLGTAWYLEGKSKQEADAKYSFGYARFSLLGALINSLVLILGSVFVIKEAIERLQHPEPANAQGMIIFALIGVAVNGFAAYKLMGGNSLNERVVSLHLMEDVLGWVAVLVAAIVLYFVYIPWLDPALSLAITAFILWGVVKRLRETLYLFLQGTPRDVDLQQIENQLISINKVDSLHHTHLWSLQGEEHVFTSHVKLEPLDSTTELLNVKNAIKTILEQYGFAHYTIETELANEECKFCP